MLDFAYPYLLYFLFALPAVWLLYWLSRTALRNKLRRFGRPAVIARLMPDVSNYKPALKLTLRLIALAAIIIVLARPRYGEKDETTTVDGAEIVIAFDVSRSMLASSTDDPNGVPRINRARMLLEKLINNLPNDKIGLVVFAASAVNQLPLTADRNLVQLTMRNDLTPGMMPNQGTSISQAIEMSTLTFPGMRDQMGNQVEADADKKQDIHRAIILITDAEDHEGDAVEMARTAASMGIQINVVGVGSGNGGRIPLGDGSYLRDDNDQEVITKFNAAEAAQLAQAGGGVYVNAADPSALSILEESLDKLKKTPSDHVTYKMNAEQFPLFAWIALVFLCLDLIIVERKTTWLRGVNFFTRHIKSKK